MAGPRKNARLSVVLDAPLAAVSSSGVLTSLGSSAATAGRNGAATSDGSVASAKMRIGVTSAQMRAGHGEADRRPDQAVLTMISFRGSRSTSIEANGVTTAIRISRTVPQMPIAATPPTS